VTAIAETSYLEARGHLHRILDQLESIRWQLLGIQRGLSEPAAEVRLDREDDETDPVTELRSTIECVLNDDIRPALEDLRDALASTSTKKEDS
jgi:hypothetical protein